MKIKELLPEMKNILDNYHNIEITYENGFLKLGKSICYNEYSIAQNHCSCHFVKYYKRYGNFQKHLLEYNLDREITKLVYGADGLKNKTIIIGEEK